MEQLLSNEIKSSLGKLIGYYRNIEFKNSGDGLYKQEIFIQTDEDYPFDEVMIGENVCSIATFRRLEAGDPIKNNELYEYFIEKLGFDFDYMHELLGFQETFGKRLYHAVEMYDCDELRKLKNEMIEIYCGVEDYFYYLEFYQAYMTIFNYNLEYIHPTKDECFEWLKKYQILDKATQEMLLIVIYAKIYSRELDVENGKIINDQLLNINVNTFMKTPYVYSGLILRTNRLLAKSELDKAIEYYDKLGSNYFSGFCRYVRLGVMQFINNDEIVNDFSKTEDCLLNCKGILAERKIINLYHFIGFYYYNNDNSKQALIYFKKYLDRVQGVDVPKIFYVIECFIDNNVEDWKEILKDHPVNENNDLSVFKQYYKLRIESNNYIDIQNYIIREVVPFLKNHKANTKLIKFFSKEMIYFSKTTKRYKNFNILLELNMKTY